MARVVDLLAAGIAQAQARPVQVLWATAVDRRSVILDTAADPGEPDAPTAEAVAAEISSSTIGDLAPGERVLTIRDGMRLHVVGGPSRSATGQWQAPLFLNGWEPYGGGYGATQWRLAGDTVQLRGLIRRGEVGATALHINTGRPVEDRTRVLTGMTNVGTQRLDALRAPGSPTILALNVHSSSTAAPTWISLDGITIPL